MVICNEQHRFIVAEQLRQLNKLTENIILEPAGRNTAPAIIALAALAAKRHSPENDPLMLVLAADHVIADEDAFRAAVRNAMPYAEAGKLVTFGIVPIYLKPDMAIFVAVKCRRVSRIRWPLKWRSLSKNRIWKPRRPMCKRRILLEQRYVPVRAGRYLEELEKYRPDILDACEKR